MKTIVCTLIGVFFLGVSGFTQTVSDVLNQAEQQMQNVIRETEKELNKVRENRATVPLLDGITVEYYGSPAPLNQVASISVPDRQTLAVTPWDKQLSEPIKQAVANSGRGYIPVNDGSTVRIRVPEMTEQQKKEQQALAKSIAGQGRVSIADIRQEAVNTLKTMEYETPDIDKIYILEGKYSAKIDELLMRKEQGIFAL